MDDGAVRRCLLEDFNIEIGGGLGGVAGKIWRIGTMGHGATQANVVYLLSALEVIFSKLGYIERAGEGVGAASRAFAEAAS